MPICGNCQHYDIKNSTCTAPYPMWVHNHTQGNEYVEDITRVSKERFAETCDLYSYFPAEDEKVEEEPPFDPPPLNDFAYGERKAISEDITKLGAQLDSPTSGPHMDLEQAYHALVSIKAWIDTHDEREVKSVDALMNKLKATTKKHENGCECIQCSPVICGCGTKMECRCPDCDDPDGENE